MSVEDESQREPVDSGSDDGAFARPSDVDGLFAPREAEALYSPPPPTVSPEDRAEFGRPAGSNAEFAPLPGERIPPSHRSVAPPVHPGLTRDYGRPDAAGAFDPEPGSRISPELHKPESPWWKPDARHRSGRTRTPSRPTTSSRRSRRISPRSPRRPCVVGASGSAHCCSR